MVRVLPRLNNNYVKLRCKCLKILILYNYYNELIILFLYNK